MGKLEVSAKSLISLPRPAKQLIMVAADAIMLPLCLWAAIVLKQDRLAVSFGTCGVIFLAAVGAAVVTFWFLGLYRSVIRFMGPQAMGAVIAGVTISAVAATFTAYARGVQEVSYAALVIYWAWALLYVAGSRFVVPSAFTHTFNGSADKRV